MVSAPPLACSAPRLPRRCCLSLSVISPSSQPMHVDAHPPSHPLISAINLLHLRPSPHRPPPPPAGSSDDPHVPSPSTTSTFAVDDVQAAIDAAVDTHAQTDVAAAVDAHNAIDAIVDAHNAIDAQTAMDAAVDTHAQADVVRALKSRHDVTEPEVAAAVDALKSLKLAASANHLQVPVSAKDRRPPRSCILHEVLDSSMVVTSEVDVRNLCVRIQLDAVGCSWLGSSWRMESHLC